MAPLGATVADGYWHFVTIHLAVVFAALRPGWTLDTAEEMIVYRNNVLVDDLTLSHAGSAIDARASTSFNEDISAAGNSLAHDANGNLTSGGTYTYEWDAFARLVRVRQGATIVATYLYDASARRVRKTFGANSTTYAYDGWRTLEEYAGANESPARQFVFGRFLDEPLAMDVNDAFGVSAIGAGDHRYYYHQNWQYSVAALSNANGALVEGYEYDPYGRHVRFHHGGSAIDFTASDTITGASASSLGNPFTYTGQRFDAETANHYYKYRTYNSSHGRFLSRDPIGIWGGVNQYRYVYANPLRYSDPYGLLPEWIDEIWGDVREAIEDWADSGPAPGPAPPNPPPADIADVNAYHSRMKDMFTNGMDRRYNDLEQARNVAKLAYDVGGLPATGPEFAAGMGLHTVSSML